MAIQGALTTAQGSDQNILVSIWQHIMTEIKPAYDAAAIAAGIDQGTALNKDGTYTKDTFGLGIIDMEIDEDDLYVRAPTIGYKLDAGRGNKPPTATGCGDGANDEWRSIVLCCVPAIQTDTSGTQYTTKLGPAILRTAVWNAIGRTFKINLVDSTQTPTNGLYPVIGYAEIKAPLLPKRAKFNDFLVIDRRNFCVEFDIKFAVLTADGL